MFTEDSFQWGKLMSRESQSQLYIQVVQTTQLQLDYNFPH